MSLKVQQIHSFSNNEQKNGIRKPVAQSSVVLPMTAKRVQKPVDKAHDGKFSFWEAAKNFGKGLVSPITGMFSSKKNFIRSAAMIAGGAAAVAVFGAPAAFVMLAAGVVTGAYHLGKGIYKAIKAKNGDDKERAFYDIGAGTGTLGLSILGAKATLKQAGIESQGMGYLTATKKCFTSYKTFAKDGYTTIKTGYYKNNAQRALKFATQSRKLRAYSQQIAQIGKEHIEECRNDIVKYLPEEQRANLQMRSKCQVSVLDKLIKERTKLAKQIKDTKADKALSAEIRESRIKTYEAQALKIKKDLESAKGRIRDLAGFRLVMDDVSSKSTDRIVRMLIEGINKGDIVLTELENYKGPNGKFYFTDAQVNAIKTACDKKGIDVKVAQGSEQIKNSGYTTLQMNIKHKNGIISELQIRGKEVNKVSDWEHIPYDLRQLKDISKGNSKIGEILNPIQVAIRKLSKEQYKQYEDYLAQNYRAARQIEDGLSVPKPELPAGIDPILKAENMELINKRISKLPSRLGTNPFAIKPQIGLVAGVCVSQDDEKKKIIK